MYEMHRASRIKRFGDMLNRIDTALEQKDLSELPADKLLELKLKYEEKLAGEYIAPAPSMGETSTEGQLWEIENLMLEASRGQISPADVKARLEVIKARGVTIKTLENERDPYGLRNMGF